MQLQDILSAYDRWSLHYDLSFGVISGHARDFAVVQMNKKPGHILEIGVGTGLSLPKYRSDMQVTALDISDAMLDRARKRIDQHNLAEQVNLVKMDAQALEFEDGAFDSACCMYVLSVAPDCVKVLHEAARVVKPGGDLWVVNHFAEYKGVMARVVKTLAPVCRYIGWNSDFPMSRVMDHLPENLKLIKIHAMRPCGLFRVLHFKKMAPAMLEYTAAS